MILPGSFIGVRVGFVLCAIVGTVRAGRVGRDGNVNIPRKTEPRAAAGTPANLWTIDTFYEGNTFFEYVSRFSYTSLTYDTSAEVLNSSRTTTRQGKRPEHPPHLVLTNDRTD